MYWKLTKQPVSGGISLGESIEQHDNGVVYVLDNEDLGIPMT